MTPDATKVSELLGFSPEARLLIVNCDDLGMYPAINLAIVDAISHGVATSCSLMAPCPAAGHAIELLRRHPAIPFGIHLTVICELPGHRWGPLTARSKVPSLLNARGEFFGAEEVDALMGQARLEELELEFRAQIELVLAANLEPTHLDWHCLPDAGREDVFELTAALAREHGLAVRAAGAPAQQRLSACGLPAPQHPLLDSFTLDLDHKQQRYAQLLRELPRGLSEWAVHPAVSGDETTTIDPGGAPVRTGDHEFLVSPQARDMITEQNITLVDYTRLRDLWRHSHPHR